MPRTLLDMIDDLRRADEDRVPVPVQAKLPSPEGADFDGKTYDPLKDYDRLGRQLRYVWSLLTDDVWRWWTIPEIADAMMVRWGKYASHQGISARLRDFRKAKYGRYAVQEECVGGGGLHVYRLDPDHYLARLAAHQAAGGAA